MDHAVFQTPYDPGREVASLDRFRGIAVGGENETRPLLGIESGDDLILHRDGRPVDCGHEERSAAGARERLAETLPFRGLDERSGAAGGKPVEEPRRRKVPVVRITVGDSLADVERRLIQKTLEFARGNKRKTAELLKLSLKTIYNKIKEYGLEH